MCSWRRSLRDGLVAHRRSARWLVLGAFLFMGGGCANIQSLDRGTVPQHTIAEVEADGSILQRALGQEGPAEPCIVHLPAGRRLPVTLALQTPMATIIPGENQLVLHRDVYLYFSPQRMMASPDGERWAELGDWDTLTELFALQRGTVQAGFGVSRERGATVTFAVNVLGPPGTPPPPSVESLTDEPAAAPEPAASEPEDVDESGDDEPTDPAPAGDEE